jgi:hypothetical protein
VIRAVRAVLVAVALGPRMDSVVILAETLGLRRGRFGRFPTVAVAALRLIMLLPVTAAVSTVSAGAFARLEGLAIILFIMDAVVELAVVADFSLPEHLEMLDQILGVGQLVLILVRINLFLQPGRDDLVERDFVVRFVHLVLERGPCVIIRLSDWVWRHSRNLEILSCSVSRFSRPGCAMSSIMLRKSSSKSILALRFTVVSSSMRTVFVNSMASEPLGISFCLRLDSGGHLDNVCLF